MIRKINSKKGDLPVTLLVIFIFALCGFALFTFFVSDFKTSNSFVGVGTLEKVNTHADEYLFFNNSGVNQDKLDVYFNVTKDSTGKRYFYEEQSDYTGSFLGIGGKKELLFTVKYGVPS